jgi:hypothetical protein
VDASSHRATGHQEGPTEKEGNTMTIVDTTTAVALFALVVLPALVAVVATGIVLGRMYAANHHAKLAHPQATAPLSPLATSWTIRYGAVAHR